MAALVACALAAGLLLAAGRTDYPDLHTILDTGAFLLSGVLALLFWDVGARVERPFPAHIAVAFALTAALEFLHALVPVEWSGPLAPIAQAVSSLRPATWPPAAHLLPIGVGGAVWLARRDGHRPLGLAVALGILGAGLVTASLWLPRYTSPTWFGITRPTLILVPALWAVVGVTCWRRRAVDRTLSSLALMAGVLLTAHVAMLYSTVPDDTAAMVAHLGKAGGYLALLLSLMRMAALDMQERLRAEAALAQLNAELEHRVVERTAELESANRSLEAEMGVRQQAEQKVRAQLERLNLLHQITRAIGERQDLRSIFQVVIRSLEDQLPLDFSCVCLHDPLDNVLRVIGVGVKSAGLADELAMTEHALIPIDQNGLSRCVHGQLVYEPDITQVPFPFPQRLARGGLRAFVVAPLLVESRVFGVLVAARHAAHSFSSGECEFLRQLSEHVALAAHQSQLYGALQQAYDDLRQTQQAVMQQERLRALGQMASGIAHDINNAISPVALYTESLLEKEPNLSDRARSYLQTIQHAIEDVSHTVARMREFYRQREPQLTLTPVALNRLVQQVVDLTRARWSDIPQQRGIVIRAITELDPGEPVVMGVESEIREALINLIFNAVDAMPDGGELALRTRAAASASEAAGSSQVHVEVVDTGAGMDEETQRRCLEPFFTTKGERGTGLGLAMVYGVLQRHSAEIAIESTVGHGTTVRLSFAAPIDVVPEADHATSEAVRPASLRILVVDDDPLLINALRDTLEGDGHVVVTASGGQDGITTFRAAHGGTAAFGVVITDLGMPHVDGRTVAGAVKASSPETPVILLTGWGQRLVAEGDVPPHVDRVLNKPPKLRELRQALADCCPDA